MRWQQGTLFVAKPARYIFLKRTRSGRPLGGSETVLACAHKSHPPKKRNQKPQCHQSDDAVGCRRRRPKITMTTLPNGKVQRDWDICEGSLSSVGNQNASNRVGPSAQPHRESTQSATFAGAIVPVPFALPHLHFGVRKGRMHEEGVLARSDHADPPIVGYALTTEGWLDPVAFLIQRRAHLDAAPYRTSAVKRRR